MPSEAIRSLIARLSIKRIFNDDLEVENNTRKRLAARQRRWQRVLCL